MNGVHDMGGSMKFGPVVAEADEPTVHAEWAPGSHACQIRGRRSGHIRNMQRQYHTRLPRYAFAACAARSSRWARPGTAVVVHRAVHRRRVVVADARPAVVSSIDAWETWSRCDR